MGGMSDKYILPIAGIALLGVYAVMLVGPLLVPDFGEWVVAFASLFAAAIGIRVIAWYANLLSDRRYDDRPPDPP